MVLVKNINDVNLCKEFKAEISVFHGHATTIQKNYNAFMNSGIIRNGIQVLDIEHVDKDKKHIRSGDKSIVTMEFINNKRFPLMSGEKFILREGSTRAIGTII